MSARPCFFCLTGEATHFFTLPPGDWPAPLSQDTKLTICPRCRDGLSAGQKADIILDHVNNLRELHNRRVSAAELN